MPIINDTINNTNLINTISPNYNVYEDLQYNSSKYLLTTGMT